MWDGGSATRMEWPCNQVFPTSAAPCTTALTLQGYTAIDASPTCKIRGPDEEVKTQQPVIYIPLPLLQTAATKKRLLSVFLSTFFFFLLICTLFKENAVSEVLWGV